MITEDAIVSWVKAQGGFLHTRKYTNIQDIEQYREKEDLIVCLTGYNNIVSSFFSRIIFISLNIL